MTRKSSAATAAANEPNETYDQLSQSAKDAWDLVGSYGFRPDKTDDGEWVALDLNGDERLGPTGNLEALASVVRTHAFMNGDESAIDSGPESTVAENETSDEDETEATPGAKLHKIAADSKGNRYFEGMEPVVDEEVAAAVGKYHAIKVDRCNMTTKEVAAKDELATICHRKSHLFKADPDNTNSKIYKVGDIVLRITNEIKEKITTELIVE